MKSLSLLVGVVVSLNTFAQKATKLSYEDTVKYSLGNYLNTPNSNCNIAGKKWKQGDTIATTQYLQAAVKAGLFDTSRVTGYRSLTSFTGTVAWPAIKRGILINKQRISSPTGLQVHTEDVQRFVQLYAQLLQTGGDSVFCNDYILKGSTGLKTLYEVRMGSRPDQVINNIWQHKNFYAGFQPLVQQLPLFKKQIMTAAQRLEQLYPDAIFPPLYFMVGNMNAAGTADGYAGQLIGIEFFSNYPGRDTTELNAWMKSVLTDTGRLVGVTLHEMIHVQQTNADGQTVLEKCITEGAADFLMYLVMNKILLPRQHAYGNAHQKELYERLLKEQDSNNISYWMYNGEIESTGVPSDMGYYIGFKICEAYYAKQTNKQQAIRNILNITDYKAFFQRSGYGQEL